MTEENGAPTPTATTLVDLLRRQAERYRDKVALSFSWNDDDEHRSQLTYHELDVKARTIASNLQQQGAAGQRALVFFRPGLDFITGYFGCLYAGVVAVPVHVRIDPLRTLVIPDAQARFALAISATQANRKAEVDRLVDGQPLQWYSIDETAGDADNWVPPDIDAGTTAMIQYTSGTTPGAPKGVVLTHRNLLTNAAAVASAWNGDDRGIGFSWLPQHHDLGLIGSVLSVVYVGSTVMLMAPTAFIERPMRWLEAVSKHGATVTVAPNFAYDLCVERSTEKERAALDLSRLSVAGIGGAPVRAATLRAFEHAFAPAGFRPEAFHPGYGLAESTLLVSCGSNTPRPVVRHIDRVALGEGRVVDVEVASPGYLHVVELTSNGRPHNNTRVVIVDPQTRQRCGPDEVGEIWTCRPCVGQGYWRRPEETEQNFSAYLADTGEGPFLRTGDLGFLRCGELFVTGRYHDLISIGGRSHYPEDIELTVQACHPALASGRGAVFAVTPESDADERIVAVHEVDPRRVGGVDLADVTAAIRAAIARHHGVGAYAVVLVEFVSIPTTPNGKIQRGQCRQRFLDGTLEVVADWYASPNDPGRVPVGV